MLNYQAEIHDACQPGGEMHSEKWMPSSLLLYDYLLAIMIICLDISESRKSLVAKTLEERLAEVVKYNAMERSHDIWSTRRNSSRDARRMQFPKQFFS